MWKEKKKLSSAKRNTNIEYIIALSLCIGFLYRIIYCIEYPVQPRDAYEYSSIVYQWEENGTIQDASRHQQLSLWILKIPYHLWRFDIIKGGIVINMILGLLIIVMGIVILNNHFHNSYAVCLSGIILATHPTLIRFSCSFLRENTYLLFALISIYHFGIYYKHQKVFLLFLTGFWGALAFLCRLEGLEIVPIVLITLFLLKRSREISMLKRSFHGILFLGSFVLTILVVSHIFHFKIIDVGIIDSRIEFEKALLLD